MILKTCITTKGQGTRYIRVEFTECDLLQWAKSYVNEFYTNTEAVDIEVESIIP